MRYNIRKMTYEDRFDRKYRCNARRFLPHMKRSNRREFRRKLKNADDFINGTEVYESEENRVKKGDE
jgi:hypothetical protein